MLRNVAARVTRPRVAGLSAVHDHPHAGMDSILGVVREDLGEVSRPCPDCFAATSAASGG
jgi:Fur family ferric uptake transcriptional regulator